MARPPEGGLIRRLLAALRGSDSPTGGKPPAGEVGQREAERRIDAARDRLKAQIPPPEE